MKQNQMVNDIRNDAYVADNNSGILKKRLQQTIEDCKKIEEYMSRFTNALSVGISWGSYFHPSNLQLPSNFANLVSFSIEGDCIKSETLQAMKNLKSLKDFRFPYSKNIFTETTIFEEICNNHPCIERLEINACECFVSITYIK